MRYRGDGEVNLQGYIGPDWVDNVANKKSTSMCCFSLGIAMISWFNRKQTSIALGLAKVEYMAANNVS